MLDGVKSGKPPHLFIGDTYSRYLDTHENNPSINGKVFEFLVCETLAQTGVTPFYYQANFERVPNASFDLVLYDTHRPVVLTMKVSLRERYKQADLEGFALRQVYRRARSYLVTLSEDEARSVQSKIDNGDIAGLDRCILADKPEYSDMIAELAKHKFQHAKPVIPLSGVVYPSA